MPKRRDWNSRGFVNATILEYDSDSQQYEIEIDGAILLSTNEGKIRLQIMAKHVNTLEVSTDVDKLSSLDDTNLNDSEIDHVLDEILETEDDTECASYSNQENEYLLTLRKQLDKQSINHTWSNICSISRATCCDDSIVECHCIQRLIFILKHYHLWSQYKAFIDLEEEYEDNGYQYLSSITSFIAILDGYNRIELMNDFMHMNTLHYAQRNALRECTKDIIPQECANESESVCQYTDRIHTHCEIYKFSQQHDDLDVIELYNLNENNLEYASMDEMMEINLQNYLDIIHSNMLHDAISNGHKYITNIPNQGKKDIVDVGNYEFGQFFNYWSSKNDHFCSPKYSDLKTELLNNKLYTISVNDYILIDNKASDFMESHIGRDLTVKREFQWMKSEELRVGDTMTIHRLIALITFCNYTELRTSFHNGCNKKHKEEGHKMVKYRNKEIAHWCRTLAECVYCFGDILHKTKLYHCIDCKLCLNRMDFQFDQPLSMTSNLSIIIHNEQQNANGICLQFERMYNQNMCNFYFDLHHISSFPIESECLVFGAKFKCTDIIFNGLSHDDYVISLRLYQKLICGEWFNHDERYLLHEKYQRRVMKLANTMINTDCNKEKQYIPYLFESITKNVNFGRKMIWINNNESQHLLSQLRQLLRYKFAAYILNTYKIITKFCDVIEMNINVKNQLDKSSRKKTICSSEYKYKYEMNQDNTEPIVLHCRCFKQFSKIKQEVMFNGYLGIKSMPKHISVLKIYGGIAMPQIPFEKWNYFYLSKNRMNNGGALFSVKKLKNIKDLKVKICLQIWSIVDSNGKSLKF